MNLDLVTSALRARVAIFSGRVAGAAKFEPLPAAAALTVPCAFVLPLDDNPEKNTSSTGIRQELEESFAVVVAISNVADELGKAASASVDVVRRQLWAALLGWSPDEENYDGITYGGGSLLALDRARLWYQFEFSAMTLIETSDGYQPTALGALPDFTGATINLDAIDPADPNLANPGPDGRIEVQFSAEMPEE